MKKLVLTAALGMMSLTSFGAELSYQDFIKSCRNPDAYGHQRPPEQIKVICADERTRWIPIESSPFELKTKAKLSTELFSDKHHVGLEVYPLPGGETNGLCPRLREDKTSVAIEVSLTCSEVLADKRGLEDICLEAIASAEAANPNIREAYPTGRLYEPCDEGVKIPEQQQQQQQEQQRRYRL